MIQDTRLSPGRANGPDLDDVASLTQALVRINSASPTLGFVSGPGETAVARFIESRLQARGIETHWLERTPGRPTVVGIVRGTGGGKSLMLNGHTDTVTLEGYDGDPLAGQAEGNNIYGRGAADMKGGLAAAMIAVFRAKSLKLRGDVILTAVADEEDESIETSEVIEAGWRADAAIITEPTCMDIITAHKGFMVFEITITGVAAHGSRPDLGVDAICKTGQILVAIDALGKRLQSAPCPSGRPDVDLPSIHVGLMKGGEEIASFPARCTLSVQRRISPSETPESAELEMKSILDKFAAADPEFQFELKTVIARLPYVIADTDPFVELVARHAAQEMTAPPVLRGERYWTDMALLGAAGIRGVVWGPRGYGLHSKHEWVEVDSIRQLLASLVKIAEEFCSQEIGLCRDGARASKYEQVSKL